MCAMINGLGQDSKTISNNLDAEKQYLKSKGIDITNMDETGIREKAQELHQQDSVPNSVVAGDDQNKEQKTAVDKGGSVFNKREGAKGPSVTVTDNEGHEITFDNYTSGKDFDRYLARNGFSNAEIDEILAEKDPEKVQAKLKAGLDAHGEKKKSGTLVLDKDRYAKLEPFKEEKPLENSPKKALEDRFSREEYPDLYNKKGELKTNKAWKEFENQTFIAAKFGGKSEKARIKEFVDQGMPLDQAKKNVKAQNESILKQEKFAQNKKLNGETLTEAEQEFVDLREGAHDVAKSTKKFSKNVEKVTERINEAIDKMNKWDWNKDLNASQRDKIKKAVKNYGIDQNMPNLYNDMFDESGDLKNKNMLYQFVMDRVTGTDAQVNKSAKKGGFFAKIFKKQNEEYTEKAASRELGLNKKDIENMGFAWENQINWGKVMTDGVAPALLGAAFGAAVADKDRGFATDSKTANANAVATVDGQTIRESKPYSGSVDYKVNGETVMQIPYDGVVDFVKEIAGKTVTATDSQTAVANASATASVSAVLPAAIIAGTTAMVHSMYDQGVNGQEKDIFRGHLLDTISRRDEELKTPEDILRACGMKESKNNQQYRLARDILSYYYDDKNQLHTIELEADWHYNAGYNSKYLNMEEGAMWLDQLKKKGRIRSVDNKVKVTIPPEVINAIFHDIQGNGNLYNSNGDVIRIDAYGANDAFGSSAEARDTKTMNRNKVNPKETLEEQLQKQPTNKAQYAVSYVDKEKHPDTVKINATPQVNSDGSRNFLQPEEITFVDSTNGKLHTYKFKLVTDTSKYPKLSHEQGPFYQVISGVDAQGNNILNPKKHVEIFRLDAKQHVAKEMEVQDNKGALINAKILYYDYNMIQDSENYPGYGVSMVNNNLIDPFNPKPKKK